MTLFHTFINLSILLLTFKSLSLKSVDYMIETQSNRFCKCPRSVKRKENIFIQFKVGDKFVKFQKELQIYLLITLNTSTLRFTGLLDATHRTIF
jgi:hypothetical protein